jgi:phage terminase small subunit
VGQYELDETERIILAAACEAADRAAEAKVMVDADGAVVDGRYGPRQHPAVAIERDSRIAMLRALRELGYEPPTPTARTAAARSARWKG